MADQEDRANGGVLHDRKGHRLRSSDVKDWLAGLPTVKAEKCDSCGTTEGPFVVPPWEADSRSPNSNCHLCAIRTEAMNEEEREVLADLFAAALISTFEQTEAISAEAFGWAVQEAGLRFLGNWRS
jgi:hypothetical protein